MSTVTPSSRQSPETTDEPRVASAAQAAAAVDAAASAARAKRWSHPATVVVLGVVLLLACCFASLAVGAQSIPLGAVIDALVDPSADAVTQSIVQARLVRTAAGVLVGVALGLTGVLLQGATRNPLADAGILGINAGAALAVVIAIFGFGIASLTGYVWFALIGATLTTMLVFGLSSLGSGGASPLKLALVGAAINAGLVSIISGILVSGGQTFDSFRQWQVGLLAGRDWEQVLSVAPFIAVGVVVALAVTPALNGLALGEDVARGLGQRVGQTRVLVCAAVALLAGGATALAGPIGFVGLVVPHALRVLVGPDHRRLVPLAIIFSPILVLTADVLGRVVMPPGEVSVGVMTAIIGAPVFIALVRRRKLSGL